MADSETILRSLLDKFPDQVKALELNPKQTAVEIEPAVIVQFFEFAAKNPELGFNYLSSISGIDTGSQIEIVYFVNSLEYKSKLTVKTRVDRLGGKIDSIHQVLNAANWFEREIWELYGVEFLGHPNLTRFLLSEDWDQGHPMLRDWTGKDFIKMPEVQG